MTNHPAPQFDTGVTVAPFKRIDQHRGVKIALAEVVATNAVEVENHSIGEVHGFYSSHSVKRSIIFANAFTTSATANKPNISNKMNNVISSIKTPFCFDTSNVS